MNRREAGENLYRQKFEMFGLSENFSFVGRDWGSEHGHRCIIRCKQCGTEFTSWNVRAVFRGRSQSIICPKCRATSNGDVSFPRSTLCEKAMEYYAEGHTAPETADKFNVPVWQIVNAATIRKVSNGLSTHQRVRQKRTGGVHRHRAKMWGRKYDPTVTLERLINRDGLRCAICGEICDPNDRRWNKRFGPMYPTIDHIKPLSKGGNHTWDNVQIAHSICNSRKGNLIDEKITDDAS